MNIEKILCPKVGKLIKTKDSVTATILDAGLDPLDLSFQFDESVFIDTTNYEFIHLSLENLYEMINLLEQSERYFTKKFKTK
jgi:hypothetical protein